MVALLLFGFWKLQIIDSDRYAQMAERNRVRSIPIIAPRGSMLDREGRVLVDNYPSFRGASTGYAYNYITLLLGS